ELRELLLPARLEVDDMTAPVCRVSLPFDQPGFLELVEKADQPAPVIAERVGNRRLRLDRVLVQNCKDGVVVRALACCLEGLERAGLYRVAEPLEQETRAAHQLERRTHAQLHDRTRARRARGCCHGVKCSSSQGSGVLSWNCSTI